MPANIGMTRFKRVTRSTLAAKTLALTDGCDTAFFIINLITDILQIQTISVTSLTDSQSLHDTIKTRKLTLDCRLLVKWQKRNIHSLDK